MFTTTDTAQTTSLKDMRNDDNFDAPAALKVKPNVHRETCLKCNGSGRYGRPSSHGNGCFACLGRGFNEYAASPEQRAAARGKAADRKAAKKAAAAGEWAALYPAEHAWIEARAAGQTYGFAFAMKRALADWGSLTAAQAAAVRKCITDDADRAVVRKVEVAAQAARTEEVQADKLEQAFAAARASQLKWPKITLAGLTFKPAPAAGKNAGAIYVTTSRRDGGDGTYLGKVLGGRFTPTRDCDTSKQAEIVGVMNDPKAAVTAHGLMYGNCAICNRELTDAKSVALGIGPVCAEKYGWA